MTSSDFASHAIDLAHGTPERVPDAANKLTADATNAIPVTVKRMVEMPLRGINAQLSTHSPRGTTAASSSTIVTTC